jgi:hypothetical protein
MFAISTFSLDSSTFELSIGDSSAKHGAAPKKQSVKRNAVAFVFMRDDSKLGLHFRSTFPFARRGMPWIVNAHREGENVSWAPVINWLVAESGTSNWKSVKTAPAVASDTKD